MTKQTDSEAEVVQAERSKVLKKAQKFVYPVGSPKHRLALISSFVFGLLIIGFIGLFTFLVYVKKDDSNFTYQISKIIPLPIGKVDSNYVTYEEYLFELKYALHFLVEQEGVDPNSAEGKKRTGELREQAEQRAYNTALAENIGKKQEIKVSDKDVEQRISILKTQASDLGGATGSSDQKIEINSGGKRFEEILKEYYNWNVNDLKRALRIQILKSKLPFVIDTKTKKQAEDLQKRLAAEPKTFAEVAKNNSADKKTSEKGGDIGFLTPETSVAYPKNFLEVAGSLKDGEVSQVIETDFGLDIIKRTETNKDQQPRVSHILLEFKGVDELLASKLKADKAEVRRYFEISG